MGSIFSVNRFEHFKEARRFVGRFVLLALFFQGSAHAGLKITLKSTPLNRAQELKMRMQIRTAYEYMAANLLNREKRLGSGSFGIVYDLTEAKLDGRVGRIVEGLLANPHEETRLFLEGAQLLQTHTPELAGVFDGMIGAVVSDRSHPLYRVGASVILMNRAFPNSPLATDVRMWLWRFATRALNRRYSRREAPLREGVRYGIPRGFEFQDLKRITYGAWGRIESARLEIKRRPVESLGGIGEMIFTGEPSNIFDEPQLIVCPISKEAKVIDPIGYYLAEEFNPEQRLLWRLSWKVRLEKALGPNHQALAQDIAAGRVVP
jgi:hypothetical protein